MENKQHRDRQIDGIEEERERKKETLNKGKHSMIRLELAEKRIENLGGLCDSL